MSSVSKAEYKDPDSKLNTELLVSTLDEVKLQTLLRSKANPNVKNLNGYTPLMLAAKQGNYKGIRTLLHWNALPNLTDQEGRSALHFAVLSTREVSLCMKVLLKYRADASQRDKEGSTVLISAARRGKLGCIKQLIRANTPVDETDNQERTALIWAARNGRIRCVLSLLRGNADVNKHGKDGKTALIAAAYHGRSTCILQLVDSRACLNSTDKTGRSALIGAALKGHMQSISRLIDARADANIVDMQGRTALHFALSRGFPEISQLLHDSGGTLDGLRGRESKELGGRTVARGTGTRSEGAGLPSHSGRHNNSCHSEDKRPAPQQRFKISPYTLLLACLQGNFPAVQRLLRIRERQPRIFATKDAKQATALHLACSHGHTEIVAALLKAGFSASSRDKNGLTALHLAASGNSGKLVRLLLRHRHPPHSPSSSLSSRRGSTHITSTQDSEGKEEGHVEEENEKDAAAVAVVDVDVASSIGSTPLHYAAQFGSPEVVQALLESRAKLSSQNRYGWHPIHYAASYGSPATLRKLLESNANIEARTRSRGPGDTPLISAVRHARPECAEALIRARADASKVNEQGYSPLVQAAFCGAVKCLELLICQRGDLDARDSEDSTALMHAVMCGRGNAARLLIASRARLDLMDSDRNTALIHAAQQSSVAESTGMIQLLVSAGSPVDTINIEGQKASSYGPTAQTRVIQRKSIVRQKDTT
mmetsp:Transcript_16509/g.26828  ORF Transcript_16509/g.26828 Transcript_16509/m.26828 type:complete len:711 (-) Transcript_16509:104-2236(-)